MQPSGARVGTEPQQPGQRVSGNRVDLPPGDSECLRRGILRVGGSRGAAQGVREDSTLMRFEQLFQARDTTVPPESLGSHADEDATADRSVPIAEQSGASWR